MIGTYRFYENGVLVGEQKNLITDEGKRAILRCLSSLSGGIARSIGVGTGTTAATVADSRLQFETARSNIDVISPDFVGLALTLKSTLGETVAGVVNEVGAYQYAYTDAYGRMLMRFNSGEEPWSVGTFQTNTNSIGGDSLRLSPAASTTATSTLLNFYLQIADYKDTDVMSLAFQPQDANLSTLRLRLYVDASNYYEKLITPVTSGYKVVSWARSTMTKVGSPTWDTITYAEIAATAGAGGVANVDLDGLRIDGADAETLKNGLVSRTVLGTPVVKLLGTRMDVEYTLDVTI